MMGSITWEGRSASWYTWFWAETLTGERPGRTTRAWEEWWRRTRSPWQARLHPPVTDVR